MFIKTGERDELTVLTDEFKNRIEAEFLELVPYNGAQYAVMLQPGADEVLVFGYREKDGGEFYDENIPDADIDAVFDIFRRDFADEFDFGDDL